MKKEASCLVKPKYFTFQNSNKQKIILGCISIKEIQISKNLLIWSYLWEGQLKLVGNLSYKIHDIYKK